MNLFVVSPSKHLDRTTKNGDQREAKLELWFEVIPPSRALICSLCTKFGPILINACLNVDVPCEHVVHSYGRNVLTEEVLRLRLNSGLVW